MWDHTDTSRQEIKHLLMLLMSHESWSLWREQRPHSNRREEELSSHYRPLVFGCCNLPLIVRLSYLLRASYHMANASSYLLRLSCPVRSCGLSVVPRTPNVDPTDEPSDSGLEDES